MWLSEQEERRLILAAQGRGEGPDQERRQKALTDLVDAFMPLVNKLAKGFWAAHRQIDEADFFINQAVLGLLAAIHRFDPERGVRLGTLATHAIVASLRQARTEYLGLSEAARRVYGKVWSAHTALCRESGHSLSVGEIAEASGVRPELVDEILQSHNLERLPPERLPAPTAAAEADRVVVGRSIWWILLELLGRPDGVKWIGLLLLHETDFDVEYDWIRIAQELASPSGGMASIWPDLCERHQVPSAGVPHRWPPVCALFPPPALTDEALRQWYSRKRKALAPRLAEILQSA